MLKNKEIDLINDMDNRLKKLFEKLRNYPEEVLHHPQFPNTWSVMQILQHLQQAEKKSLDYVKKKTQGPASGIPKRGLPSWWRFALLKIAYGLPMKFKAPDKVSKEVFNSEQPFWELVRTWSQERLEMKQFLSNLPAEYHKRLIYRSYGAGRQTQWAMLRFFSIHFDRHLKQIHRQLGLD